MREREGLIFWIFEEHDYKMVWILLKNSHKNYMFRDTKQELIKLIYCNIFGHKLDYPNIGDLDTEQDIYCKHCDDYIKTLSYKEHRNILRIKKLENII